MWSVVVECFSGSVVEFCGHLVGGARWSSDASLILLGNIGVAVHWCSRWCLAARVNVDQRSRFAVPSHPPYGYVGTFHCPGPRSAFGAKMLGTRSIRQSVPTRKSCSVICTTKQHRKPELEDPQGGERPRPLPDRAGRAQVRLPGDHEPRSDRQGPQALGQPMESSAQRLRTRLPRTTHHNPKLTVRQPVTPLA